ncbi:hypothetical protein [Actinokineospora inagensis]|nr:hypothetical protein [Actinokineospora inagensis]
MTAGLVSCASARTITELVPRTNPDLRAAVLARYGEQTRIG